jgi:thiamine pyrophosphate-dependent acetolactate synthase large subunit-like protein
MDITIGVIVVTRSADFFETGLSVLNDVRGEVFHQVSIDTDIESAITTPGTHPVYQDARAKAVRFLNKRKDRMSVKVIQGSSLDQALDKILALPPEQTGGCFQIGMVYIDYADPAYENVGSQVVDRQIAGFYARLRRAGVPAFHSPYSVAVFTLPRPQRVRYQPLEYIECVLPHDRAVLQAELLCLWMDFFEMSVINRRVKPVIKDVPSVGMATEIVRFMIERHGSDWLNFYYTGSVVSSLINSFEAEAAAHGVVVLRGPSEHSLACGAMANWQLYRKPFVIIVTSGMIDEFKGTIANLREARAQGFIICAENRPDQWFAFQGTISRDEDTRDVLAARRIPYLFIDDANRLQQDLISAAEKYDEGKGPVVLLVTPAVLEASGTLQVPFPPAPHPKLRQEAELRTQVFLEEVVEIINGGPDRLLWQCGRMDEEELELTLSIAKRAGVALVDSLAHPGSVPKFHKGERVANYLGTLAVYGYGPRVYSFLHTHDKINSPSEQYLFFLKSKLSQISTPFSGARLERKLKIVQVTNNPDHVSPYTNYPLVLDYREFLKYVDEHLEVPPELLERRNQIIASEPDTPSDVLSRVPSMPLSPNFFFNRLNELVEKLILERGYEYTGLYDVGRCGISAVRNVARTRPGFSGWYGRALMGDALQATLSVAFTSPTNVLAFIGDGAKALVPDVLPSLIENAMCYPDRLNKNITIFYFINGGHSVINSYQERFLFNRTSRQMRLVNILHEDWEDEINGLQVRSRTLHGFDSSLLASALLQHGRINLFSVLVSHNNEGDGLSLYTATGWQRDSTPPALPAKPSVPAVPASPVLEASGEQR